MQVCIKGRPCHFSLKFRAIKDRVPLAANGQDSRFIDQVFPTADTSDFSGSVRCLTPEPGRFSAVAFELDAVDRIFTTLPVVPVVEVP